MAEKQRLVVIDGKSVFYRGYYAMPNLATSQGQPTGGVYGFAVMGLEVLKKYQPDYVVVAWDKPKTNIRRRREIYPEYKANRKPAPPDFYEQVPLLHELLEAFGWPLYEIDDHEADDIMGTFATQARKKGLETILVTSDHDVLQLVNGDVKIAMLKKGLTNVELYDAKLLKENYGLTPEQMIDYKALRGDTSDNLPGVAGVGEKTAKELITKYGTLDEIYKHLDELKPALKAKLEAGRESADITKQLVELDCDVPVKLDWKAADIHNTEPDAIAAILKRFEFRTLLRQLPKDMQLSAEASEQASLMDLKPATASQGKTLDLKGAKEVLLHVWCSGAHGQGCERLLISTEPGVYQLINLAEYGAPELVAALKELHKMGLIGYDTKAILKVLLELGVPIPEVAHDVRSAAFLINALIREPGITALAATELGYEGGDLDKLPVDEFDARAGQLVAALWAITEKQRAHLDTMPSVKKLAHQIEWPVLPVLARMERAGIGLNVDYMEKFSKELDRDIKKIEQEIYNHAGVEFNIASPGQLAEVLFEKLQLPTAGVKKGKTGYSTAAPELDKLRGLHPVINLITQYREFTKLKGTYVDALPKLVADDNRVHTTFATDVAATGRLSSHDPNLQNIPVRTELGKQIRRAFTASPGHVFVSADYSQFELRLAAVLAGDDELIEAFNDGLDVHTRTAAQVYGVALEDVTKDQRRDAKVINFGILYGMSPHGLSIATGMSQVDARAFIERYFELRKPLLDYIDKTKKLAHDQGYVETMFGRRRPTPDVQSSNFVVRQAAERAAINMPIQGTEADLMKLAMVKVDEQLPEGAEQLLQIHDSILVECHKSDGERVGKMMKEVMEGVYKLPVTLDVDISIGQNWGEL